LGRVNRQNLVSIHSKHDLQVFRALRVAFVTGPAFPSERLLDYRGFTFLDLKDPALDRVFNLGNGNLRIVPPEDGKYLTMKCLT